MNRGLYALLGTQFLTAFADNAVLFTAIAIVLTNPDTESWYVPALQSVFLVAFVVLAPWVGPFADSRPKAVVLLLGNSLKAAGTLLILAGVDLLYAYALVGVGAAVYGPAKYGILPEMVSRDRLVQANGWIESSTIAAIIVGTIVGARIADQSTHAALIAVIACYALSLSMTFLIPHTAPHRANDEPGIKHFIQMMRSLFATRRARFVVLAMSLFWATAVVLRLLLVAWAPIVLLTQSTADIADLMLAFAIGLVIGALLVPHLAATEALRRTRRAAYTMGLCILILSFVDTVWPARAVLVAIGITGGLFIVPINATLQEIGHQTIGSGGAVALQNFFENAAMLVAASIYTLAAANGALPDKSIVTVGAIVLIATFFVSRRLPQRLVRRPPS